MRPFWFEIDFDDFGKSKLLKQNSMENLNALYIYVTSVFYTYLNGIMFPNNKQLHSDSDLFI